MQTDKKQGAFFANSSQKKGLHFREVFFLGENETAPDRVRFLLHTKPNCDILLLSANEGSILLWK